MPVPVLTLIGITKRFGSVQALDDVDLEIRAGEVMGLVGENGAGKSTLVKVISGVSPADRGEVYWEGDQVSIGRPHDATALGIATVYQDLSLCDNLDVVANLFLGKELVKHGVLDEIGMERTARELLSSLSVSITNLGMPVSALSGGQRQSVAIARAMLGSPKLVILDEPTAALGIAQTNQVLSLIERLQDQRIGVIFSSHSLNDVMAVADRVVVLRLGQNAGEFDADEVTEQDIVAAMIGTSTPATFHRPTSKGATSITEVGR